MCLSCVICNLTFEVIVSHAAKRRTCGAKTCYSEYARRRMIGNQRALGHAPNATTFRFGHETWNKGVLGTHFSPRTEFKKGARAVNHLNVGTIRVRTFKKTREKRAFIKVAEPNRWRLLAHVVWEAANGPIPKGRIVHHIDRNTLHDDVFNLTLETRASHLMEHRPEFEKKRLFGLRGQQRSQRRSGVVGDQSQHTAG